MGAAERFLKHVVRLMQRTYRGKGGDGGDGGDCNNVC